MCGIFGFALAEPVKMAKVFRILRKLEVHQYPNEKRPVGGYGAGIAILGRNINVMCEKVGKVGDSPAKSLSEIFKVDEARILVGHVRMPSPEFMETAEFRETAQPYVASCRSDLTVVSAHNGKVENYVEIRKSLSEAHFLESEKRGLIDSEIIPHLFEETLTQKNEAAKALERLFSLLQGSSTISLLQIQREKLLLHLVHKGKTRGVTVWTNGENEVIFCSRKEPLSGEFDDILVHGKFKEKYSIGCQEEAVLKLTVPLAVR